MDMKRKKTKQIINLILILIACKLFKDVKHSHLRVHNVRNPIVAHPTLVLKGNNETRDSYENLIQLLQIHS